MNLLFLGHFAATWGLVGLIWTVQSVHYPLFAQVGCEAFLAYHRRHTRLITWIVAPLMAAELLSAMALFLRESSSPQFQWSLALLACNWLSTAFLQIPLHNQLASGFQPTIHARLVRSNWIRTAAWSGRGILVLLDALR